MDVARRNCIGNLLYLERAREAGRARELPETMDGNTGFLLLCEEMRENKIVDFLCEQLSTMQTLAPRLGINEQELREFLNLAITNVSDLIWERQRKEV